jgi:hypothetical protein
MSNDKQPNQRFMTPYEQFESIALASLSEEGLESYKSMKHVRHEFGYVGRKFVAYQMEGREPQILGTYRIYDFVCDDVDGATTQFESLENPGQLFLVGYTPIKVPEHNVWLHIPIQCKLNYAAFKDDPTKFSLSFGLVVRTQSRYHLRERFVTYFEAWDSYVEEFGLPTNN